MLAKKYSGLLSITVGNILSCTEGSMRAFQLLALALLATAARADVFISWNPSVSQYLACTAPVSCSVSGYFIDPYDGLQYPMSASAYSSSAQTDINFDFPENPSYDVTFPTIWATGDFSQSIPINAPAGSYALFDISDILLATSLCDAIDGGMGGNDGPSIGLTILESSFTCGGMPDVFSQASGPFKQRIVGGQLKVSFSYYAFPMPDDTGTFGRIIPVSFDFAVDVLKVNSVPEPSTLLLLASAGLSLAALAPPRKKPTDTDI